MGLQPSRRSVSAYLLGAGKVIAIDSVAERLRMAEEGGAVTFLQMTMCTRS